MSCSLGICGMKGGACPCSIASKVPTPFEGFQRYNGMYNGMYNGGYKATKRNLTYLKNWKNGKSIGFTMLASLKAKGLIPRANGKKYKSEKYKSKKQKKQTKQNKTKSRKKV